MTARSYLCVPDEAGDRLLRSATRGADIVIADLEDSVGLSRRPSTRREVAAWLAFPAGGTRRWVRLNAGPCGLEDLRTIWSSRLEEIVLPKVGSPEEVDTVVVTLHRLAPRGSTPELTVAVIIETTRALRDVEVIAARPGVRSLQHGDLDLAADHGCRPAADETELLFARSGGVAASAAAGLDPPVGSVSPDVSDLDAFRVSSERLRRLGLEGRAPVHPAQVTVANKVFSPAARKSTRPVAYPPPTARHCREVRVWPSTRRAA